MLSTRDLVSVLTSLPESEFLSAIALAVERREWRPAVAPSEGVSRAATEGALDVGAKGCCGLTFTSHAKRVVCPLCGKSARAS